MLSTHELHKSQVGSAYESEIKDFIALLKPGVMTLVVFTAIVGILLAPGKIDFFTAIMTVLCTCLGSGASGAINMWYDRDIDKIMTRTAKRPIPSGKIAPHVVLEFGVCTAFLSVFLMAMCVNYVASAVLLSAILFYVFIYTIWLKRRTPQNIVIGGAAGSFPPMIGWAAVTGNVSIESLILFLIIFMWTPPHFWALAIYKSDDYKKAGVPMLPVVKGQKSTKLHIFVYAILMWLTTLVPYYIGMLGVTYFIAANILGIYFVWGSFKLLKANNLNYAPKLFGYSILYLFILYGMMVVDRVF
ncbi:MAG: protoheme IX farnesyltransferase [Alphaproteobacteria bacterium 33-17]|nr:MAG: protoheme IX farnesyltransferase [Alphaproteobacteria bacterium 33-17]